MTETMKVRQAATSSNGQKLAKAVREVCIAEVLPMY